MSRTSVDQYQELSWNQVEKRIGSNASILLGNGFSIACDNAFRYNNLLEVAAESGLSETAVQVFQEHNTTNFEAVMQSMDMAINMSRLYSGVEECPCSGLLRQDIERTKNSLVKAVTKVHGKYNDQKKLPEDLKESCISFLTPYKNIYTLNYDFLLYWVFMRGLDQKRWAPTAGDGFYGPEYSYVDIRDAGIRFLHGALHLYSRDGKTAKHVFRDRFTLLRQVTNGLTERKYPLFIAEGTSERKLAGIKRNEYLWDCFSEFSHIPDDLVIYGSELGESDNHLVDAIRRNLKLKRVFIGSFGRPSETLKRSIASISSYRREREVYVYDSSTINPWNCLQSTVKP